MKIRSALALTGWPLFFRPLPDKKTRWIQELISRFVRWLGACGFNALPEDFRAKHDCKDLTFHFHLTKYFRLARRPKIRHRSISRFDLDLGTNS